MSKFGKNIRKIRNAKNISQTAFADLFNLKRGSIGAYEEGRAEAKFDKVIEIAEYFQLTLDQLLRKDLTINEIYHIREKSKKLIEKAQNALEPKESSTQKGRLTELKPVNINNIEERLFNIEESLNDIKELLSNQQR